MSYTSLARQIYIRSTPGIKWLGPETDHSHLSSAEVNSEWNHTSTPQYVFIAWCFIKEEIHLHGVVLS